MDKKYRYKIAIEYEGTNFVGWQRQNNGISVQEVLEQAISALTKENVRLFGAGRTDAGVHALEQIAHFDLEKFWPAEVIQRGSNYFLKQGKQHSVAILEAQHVPLDFHARFSAIARQYFYKIQNRCTAPILERNRAWWVKKSLNAEIMHDAAQILVGYHNFNAFRSTHCQAKSPLKTIEKIAVRRDKQYILFTIKAPSFLHNQVRIIVGTLSKIGNASLNKKELCQILESQNRTKAAATAPAHGLYLQHIFYAPFPPQNTA